MKTLGKRIEERPWIGWVVFLITVLMVFLAGLFTYTIVERRTEAQFVFQPVKDLHPLEPRNEVWGEAFPRQFNTYNQMADTTFRSEFLGSTRLDLLEKNPRLVILFAGFAFATDYNLARGHYYSVTDVHETLRTGAPMQAGEGPMPATCWSCKSADVPRLMAEMGDDEFYAARWSDVGHEMVNPIGCVNCHDPQTMNLRISQPALVEAFERGHSGQTDPPFRGKLTPQRAWLRSAQYNDNITDFFSCFHLLVQCDVRYESTGREWHRQSFDLQ